MTTQAGVSTSDPDAYRDNLFALLGDRDALGVLEQTPALLAAIVERHSASVLRTRPFPGKWTANEIIGHLADGELVYGYRLRLILSEDDPAMLGTNQDAWVARQRHNERAPAELVAIFRTLRELNVDTWRRLAPEDWNRVGLHNERGPESLAVMLRMMAGHDLSHLDQIARRLQAVSQGA
jgi:DinB superfamily